MLHLTLAVDWAVKPQHKQTNKQTTFHEDLYKKVKEAYCIYADIQKFNIKYLVMYKVQMHIGTIIR